ncbi:TPA: LSM domain protein [Staphylococcus pseudintermedius]|uniref:LSM domain protein n=1 Tax=Staphylococcus pseudintermedius TaxID=283734 RepID=UPI000BBBE735|nr:LSM domain protein [Staphylococcus pseudintermedius]EGQ2715951.1 LSM domain protein [Staphylococcus pseudintermedius]EGQ2743675.1 LSM domain protein [Staphylococcus pseudintermedius]EGQ2747785.1 LSM domain protein [Staphylococcus pseudintermedius]EGQ2915021.1 LSM domain protein [Staphylococcus pseudintermedius]EGQ3469614.1 LSM domain protein [Staphylococcus pseudintermedius]
MKLWTYVGKDVLIELKNGQQFVGEAISYDDEIANNSGEESIYLDDGIQIYDLYKSQIKSIKILD